MNALRKYGVHAVLLLSLAVGVQGAAGAPSGQSWDRWMLPRNPDLTATAIPGPESPHVVSKAMRVARVGVLPFKADATASGSATCDGCTADASALQIVYVPRGSRGTVDNVATAWSRCADCRATALSVQVVVVQGPPEIRANNRALSVNATCEGCHSASAAFQVVVAGADDLRMSTPDRRELEAWVAEQAARLRDTSSQPPARRVRPDRRALQDLERLVNDSLGTRTVQRRGQLRDS